MSNHKHYFYCMANQEKKVSHSGFIQWDPASLKYPNCFELIRSQLADVCTRALYEQNIVTVADDWVLTSFNPV